MRRCPIISGAVVVLFLGKSQKLRREIAQSSPLKASIVRDPEARRGPKTSSSGSSGGSPSASACSISRRARSAAALVSGAA